MSNTSSLTELSTAEAPAVFVAASVVGKMTLARASPATESLIPQQWLRRRVWCEPTKRLAYDRSAAPSADICRFAETFSVRPNSQCLQSSATWSSTQKKGRDGGGLAGTGGRALRMLSSFQSQFFTTDLPARASPATHRRSRDTRTALSFTQEHIRQKNCWQKNEMQKNLKSWSVFFCRSFFC